MKRKGSKEERSKQNETHKGNVRKIEKTREGMAQNKTEQTKARNNRKEPESMRRN